MLLPLLTRSGLESTIHRPRVEYANHTPSMRYDHCRCANCIPKIVCRRAHVLVTLIVLVCAQGCPSISDFAFVLFFVVLLPIPLVCLFIIARSIFPDVYCRS